MDQGNNYGNNFFPNQNPNSQQNPNPQQNPNSQQNPNFPFNQNFQMDLNMLNPQQLAQMFAYCQQSSQNPSPHQIPSTNNTRNLFPSQNIPNFFPSPTNFPTQNNPAIYPSQNLQSSQDQIFSSPNLQEFISPQRFARSLRNQDGFGNSSRNLFPEEHEDVSDTNNTNIDLNSDQPTEVVRVRPQLFTIEEDVALCSAYINAGGSTTIGADIRGRDLWVNIQKLFNQARDENPTGLPYERNENSLVSRWKRINGDVSKFAGTYAEAQRMKTSGQNEEDVISDARKLFNALPKAQKESARWNLDHCWIILRRYPKWQGGVTAQSSGSSKRSESDIPTSEDDPVRPEGVKKSKRKSYASSESSSNAESIIASIDNWSISNRDQDIQRNEMGKQMLEYIKTQKEERQERRQREKEEWEREKEERRREKEEMRREKEQERRFKMFELLYAKDEDKLSAHERARLEELKQEFMM